MRGSWILADKQKTNNFIQHGSVCLELLAVSSCKIRPSTSIKEPPQKTQDCGVNLRTLFCVLFQRHHLRRCCGYCTDAHSAVAILAQAILAQGVAQVWHGLVLVRCPVRLLIRWEEAEGSGPKR